MTKPRQSERPSAKRVARSRVGKAKAEHIASHDELLSAPATDAALNGSQSIHRAFSLLRIVASSRAAGMRLGELAAATGLHVATAHRLLGALGRERFVIFDPYSRLYHIGSEFLTLGEGARELRIRNHYRPVLERIADSTEDCVYLSTLSGNDSVCIDRVEGRYPIRTITLDVGARRPLGVGGGSLALLAALPEQRAEAALVANESRFGHYSGMTIDEVRALVAVTRRQGFSFNDGRVIDGVSAVGLAVVGRDGNPIAAISVAAINARMKPARRRTIIALIRTELQGVEEPLDRS